MSHVKIFLSDPSKCFKILSQRSGGWKLNLLKQVKDFWQVTLARCGLEVLSVQYAKEGNVVLTLALQHQCTTEEFISNFISSVVGQTLTKLSSFRIFRINWIYVISYFVQTLLLNIKVTFIIKFFEDLNTFYITYKFGQRKRYSNIEKTDNLILLLMQKVFESEHKLLLCWLDEGGHSNKMLNKAYCDSYIFS